LRRAASTCRGRRFRRSGCRCRTRRCEGRRRCSRGRPSRRAAHGSGFRAVRLRQVARSPGRQARRQGASTSLSPSNVVESMLTRGSPSRPRQLVPGSVDWLYRSPRTAPARSAPGAVLVAVAEELHFGRAAARLRIAPAVAERGRRKGEEGTGVGHESVTRSRRSGSTTRNPATNLHRRAKTGDSHQ
jgi:hypothetical protein